jgi:predicted glycosyltransferase
LDVASALTGQLPHCSILVLSNLSILGRFRAPQHVDCIRLPGIGPAMRAAPGAAEPALDVERTLRIRRAIATSTAESFRPDLVVIDRDPAHLPAEMRDVLTFVRAKLPRTRIVWALPDVVGEPRVVSQEWAREGVFDTLDRLCDEVWVYGVKAVFDQAREYKFPRTIAEKIRYTGYLRSPAVPPHRVPNDLLRAHPERPLVLVTAGGGASGYPLISNYMDFLEQANGSARFQSVVIAGPMMPSRLHVELSERARRLPHVIFHRFSKHVLQYVRHSQLTISRGGYNTLCAQLTYRKPSIVVPDVAPPHEHLLRARVFDRLRWCGLVRPGELSPDRLGGWVTAALSGSSDLPRPDAAERVSLDGHLNIGERVRELVPARPDPSAKRSGAPRREGLLTGRGPRERLPLS